MTKIGKAFLGLIRGFCKDIVELFSLDDEWHISGKKVILYVLAVITLIFVIGLVLLGRGTFPQLALLVLVLLVSYLYGRRINRVDDKQREELPKKRRARLKRKKQVPPEELGQCHCPRDKRPS